ncbi:hypothetical protein [Sphingomonas sp. G-3-2-10]|uniref:hypothetical protein n=1 Tax=Sphingomonas sp. G-3-2-10 TaxID=2728838 RepID=UPI00146C084D|nr:hypothetical protein [Sphingomonas sp. G-3-2-10]NML07936.1 hypothetical protein [Sphingomonas sp. G-3-2-10]
MSADARKSLTAWGYSILVVTLFCIGLYFLPDRDGVPLWIRSILLALLLVTLGSNPIRKIRLVRSRRDAGIHG